MAVLQFTNKKLVLQIKACCACVREYRRSACVRLDTARDNLTGQLTACRILQESSKSKPRTRLRSLEESQGRVEAQRVLRRGGGAAEDRRCRSTPVAATDGGLWAQEGSGGVFKNNMAGEQRRLH